MNILFDKHPPLRPQLGTVAEQGDPRVAFALFKYQWASGDNQLAYEQLKAFCEKSKGDRELQVWGAGNACMAPGPNTKSFFLNDNRSGEVPLEIGRLAKGAGSEHDGRGAVR